MSNYTYFFELYRPKQQFETLREHLMTTWTEFCYPPVWTVFILRAWTKTNIFDPSPTPHLVNVVIEWPFRLRLEALELLKYYAVLVWILIS